MKTTTCDRCGVVITPQNRGASLLIHGQDHFNGSAAALGSKLCGSKDFCKDCLTWLTERWPFPTEEQTDYVAKH